MGFWWSCVREFEITPYKLSCGLFFGERDTGLYFIYFAFFGIIGLYICVLDFMFGRLTGFDW
jgi:hypothetical protein